MSTLIVGFGSPFGDDRFGWLVIEQLQQTLAGQQTVKAICCDHSGIDWIHQYQPTEQLIFIDAVKSGAAAGTLHHLTLTPSALETLPTSHSSHGIGLREGVTLAATLVELPAEIEFYGVEIASCEVGTAISAATTHQATAVASHIKKSLRNL